MNKPLNVLFFSLVIVFIVAVTLGIRESVRSSIIKERTLYNRGLIAGFALVVCPNVNQGIISKVQKNMSTINHCGDFDNLGNE